MRTNIEIDDKLMDFVMSTGDFKTKREAVEEGLRLIKRRKIYDGLLALQGKLHWLGDDESAWAQYRAEQVAKVEAKAAGLPFEGEIDPVFLGQPISSVATQAKVPLVQEPVTGYAVARGAAK